MSRSSVRSPERHQIPQQLDNLPLRLQPACRRRISLFADTNANAALRVNPAKCRLVAFRVAGKETEPVVEPADLLDLIERRRLVPVDRRPSLVAGRQAANPEIGKVAGQAADRPVDHPAHAGGGQVPVQAQREAVILEYGPRLRPQSLGKRVPCPNQKRPPPLGLRVAELLVAGNINLQPVISGKNKVAAAKIAFKPPQTPGTEDARLDTPGLRQPGQQIPHLAGTDRLPRVIGYRRQRAVPVE